MLIFLKSYIFPLPFFLLCLYVFFMYTAQETLFPTIIHSLVMYTMVIVVFINLFFKKKMKLTQFTIWYFFFFLFLFFSSIFYGQSDISILFPTFVSLIISFCFIQTINSEEKLIKSANVYVVSALVMGLMIWSSGQLDYIYWGVSGEERLGTEITGNANVFTALFMYSGVFASWFMVFEEKTIYKIVYALLFLFILFIMILSGGRKTIISIMMSLIVFMIMKEGGKKSYVKNLIFAILIVFGIFFIIMNNSFLYDLIGERFEGLFNLFTGKGSDIGGDDIREQMFVLAIDGWLDKPILGHGIDSFKFYNQSVTGHFYYSHNNFVELLYDVGIIGFLLFYSFYFYIYRSLRNINIIPKFRALGYGLLCELLIFDFGGVSYYLVGNIVILAIAYCCISCQKTR